MPSRYEDDEDDRPRRSRRRNDDFDDDDRPMRDRRGADRKPGLAATAGVFWAIWCAFCLIGAAVTLLLAVQAELDDRSPMPPMYTPTGVCSAFLLVVVAGLCGFAAFFTLTGRAKSLTLFAVLSMVFSVAVVLARTVMGFAVGMELEQEVRGTRIALPMAFRSFLFSALLMSGVMLAGLFAVIANGRYRVWRGTDRGRR